MCERKHATQYKVSVYMNGKHLGDSWHWDKAAADRTYNKQNRKAGVTVVMYDPNGRKIRG